MKVDEISSVLDLSNMIFNLAHYSAQVCVISLSLDSTSNNAANVFMSRWV